MNAENNKSKEKNLQRMQTKEQVIDMLREEGTRFYTQYRKRLQEYAWKREW